MHNQGTKITQIREPLIINFRFWANMKIAKICNWLIDWFDIYFDKIWRQVKFVNFLRLESEIRLIPPSLKVVRLIKFSIPLSVICKVNSAASVSRHVICIKQWSEIRGLCIRFRFLSLVRLMTHSSGIKLLYPRLRLVRLDKLFIVLGLILSLVLILSS